MQLQGIRQAMTHNPIRGIPEHSDRRLSQDSSSRPSPALTSVNNRHRHIDPIDPAVMVATSAQMSAPRLTSLYMSDSRNALIAELTLHKGLRIKHYA